VTPSLDFDLDGSIQRLDAVSKPFTHEEKTAASSGNLFQTFTRRHEAHKVEYAGKSQPWRDFLEPPHPRGGLKAMPVGSDVPKTSQEAAPSRDAKSLLHIPEGREPFQALNSYVLFDAPGGLVVLHQQLAHERILYERLTEAMQGRSLATQQSLFPATVELGPQDAALMSELGEDLKLVGYDIEPFGGNSFLIRGTPSGFGQGTDAGDLEDLLEAYKHSNPSLNLGRRERLARAMAARRCIKAGRRMEVQEMRRLVEDLSACNQPNLSPGGSPTYVLLSSERIDGMFIR
jgi:DNA mismatch repair protein MutL